MHNMGIKNHVKRTKLGTPRISRKVDLNTVTTQPTELSPGMKFEITCNNHGKIDFDFSPFQRSGLSLLAEDFRDAVWSLRHKVQGNTLHSYLTSGMKPFWLFLEEQKTVGLSIQSLADITPETIQRFIAWLNLQIAAKGKNKGNLWKHSAKKAAYDRIKTLLLNRKKYTATEVDPKLEFPKNPFPNTNIVTQPREAYSDDEMARILSAINTDLRLIDESGHEALRPSQVLITYLLALAVATGRNPQSLLDLKRDSLRPHPLKDREILITEKRRGYSTHVTSYKKEQDQSEAGKSFPAIPNSVGGHFRALCAFTEPLINDAESQYKDHAVLFRMSNGPRKGEVIHLHIKKFNQFAEKFVRRHDLKNDQGGTLSLYLGRLRPTFGSKLYEKTRDIRKVQVALGHATPTTTARHYITLPDESIRNHLFVGSAMAGWTTMDEGDRVQKLAADGELPLGVAENLLNGGYNTLIARCKNPFRSNDKVCAKYLPCFTCPQMVVFEDDLWRLYSFYYKLLSERIKINSSDWMKTYGPVIKIIDIEIAPQFPSEIVVEAKKRAQVTPHPAWPRSEKQHA
jgi:integrase